MPDALYRAPVELWDRSMQCLAVLLDPGRLKRWVGPNISLGPPLKAGYEYTLVIGSGMTDLYGRRLVKNFRKRFRVENPIRQHTAVEQWQIMRPLAESRRPLMLSFPRPLDWGSLLSAISIESSKRVAIVGDITIDDCERTWSFIPSSAWAAETYTVRVASY